jgi:hypothetical protein
MSKRRLVLAVAVLALLGLAVGFGVLRHQSGPRARFDRIRLGMGTEQVEAVMGMPAGEYGTRADDRESFDDLPVARVVASGRWDKDAAPRWVTQLWSYDEGVVSVSFDEAGAVVYKQFIAKRPSP